MAKSKEYLALKNFIHNTCGIDRAELRKIVREAIKEQTADELQRYAQTTEFGAVVTNALKQSQYIYYGVKSVLDDKIVVTLKEAKK